MRGRGRSEGGCGEREDLQGLGLDLEWIWLFVEVDCDDEKWTVCPDDGRWNPGVLHALIVVFMTVVEEPVFDGIWKVVEPKVA